MVITKRRGDKKRGKNEKTPPILSLYKKKREGKRGKR